PVPMFALTYILISSESYVEAGIEYTCLDRFGRIVDQRWWLNSNTTTLAFFQYGYDRDGNRLYRNNLLYSAFSELYHVSGASNGYDGLNQLTAFSRGTLSDTNSDGVPDTISSPSHSQSFSMDVAGNFSSVTTDGT